MPTTRGANVVLRVWTIAAIALAVLIAGFLLLRDGGGSYSVSMTLQNANQLVKGNQVKVGGVPVGKVASIKLTDDGRARIELSITDDGLTPLHEGTQATVRSASLSGIANRYVSLVPGSGKDTIGDGGRLPDDAVHGEVDLDEVLNALDPTTQKELQGLLKASGGALGGNAGRQLNAGLHALNPALSQVGLTEEEVLRDQPAFERFILESADVVTAVSTRSPELPRLVADTHGTLDAIAQRTGDLDTALRRLPPTLRQTNTTLVNLRGAIGDLRPTVRLARPVAPLLAGFLTDLQPTARQARPVVADLRRTIDSPGDRDLLAVLRGLVPVARAGVPALRSADATVRDALPILTEIRPYTPDLVGGLLNGFGGTTGGYYDANGHFARISFQSSVYSGQGLLSLLPAPNSSDGLAGFRRGVLRRCPGAATQSAPDGSNPYVADPASCSTGDNPK